MNIDYSKPEWKKQKYDYAVSGNGHLDSDDIYNYAIMMIDYAKTHSEKEWFDYVNESTKYTYVKRRKNAAEILERIHKLYEEAKQGICTISSNFDTRVEALVKEGRAEIIDDFGYAISFKPVI